jgi:hypothetical protein
MSKPWVKISLKIPVVTSLRLETERAVNHSGIILESNPVAAAGPEGLWPGGSGGVLFLTELRLFLERMIKRVPPPVESENDPLF